MEALKTKIDTIIANSDKHPIILFDGVCNLCNGFVQFIIKRDPAGQFRFVALQSEVGEALLAALEFPTADMSTVILVENGQVYTHSDVALRIVRRLGGAWPLLYSFRLIPNGIRNGIYRIIAKNRYAWFGQRDQCMIPTPDLKARFY
ncbi:MAG: thiol-disulfide oxidoreductase DCC family protein [Bacteroidota bacterium]